MIEGYMGKHYSAVQALKIAAHNEFRAWVGNGVPGTAQARFASGERFRINHKPKFLLSRSDMVFTIGSCFAREIEGTLGVLQIPFGLRGHGIEPQHFESWDEASQTGGGVASGQLSRGAFNKYCVHSMTHDVRRVLFDTKYSNEGLIELKDGQWFDPHSSGLKLLPLDTALKNRLALHRGMAQIKTADVVFITLGMTESWVDTETGLVMNQNPGGSYLRRFGDRFEFIDYGFGDVVDEINNMLSVIREHCNPNMKFILTVSPVPLGTTFQNVDIVTANTNSKSVLRAAAEEITRAHDFVDYFPSYEIVTNSPRHLAWREDQLHVAWPMVQHVMETFKQAYYPEIVTRLVSD